MREWDEARRGSRNERAEERVRAALIKDPATLSPEEVARVFNELVVHQVELEMQNEELRVTQEALDASHWRYFELYEMAPVGYLTLSGEGTILEANLTAARMLGVPRSDLVEQPLSRSILPEDQDIFYRARKGLLETGIPRSFDLRLLRRGGALMWARLDAVTTQREEDRATVLRVTMCDVTEQKRAEEQVCQCDKLIAIGQLAGGIAHDFNNLLTAVIGYSDLLARSLKTEQEAEYAAGILEAARRAADLTKQLLAFARKGSFETRSVDVRGLIADVVNLLRPGLDKRVRVHESVDPCPSLVVGDPSQLQSMILNLAMNARDAMPQGGDLTIATGAVTLDETFCERAPFRPAPGRYLRVTVSDTGLGMTEAVKHRMFEPFFTTKEVGQGTGLGLASVYGATERHKGTITFESELGKGTSFALYLPLAETAEAAPPKPTELLAPRGTGRILIVDDEAAVLRLAARLLRDLGYEVKTARSGGEAVALYSEAWQTTDLVLLDLTMPDIDGRETFLAMRRLNPHVKAILLSGYDLGQEPGPQVPEGMLGFLQKPYEPAMLARRVAEALALAR